MLPGVPRVVCKLHMGNWAVRLSLIVAMSRNRVIGRDGDLPWRLSADLQRFKQLTMGHHIIMGRTTYESIGRPLPGRHSVVLSRDPHFSAPEVTVVRSLEEACQVAASDNEAFVIGGAQIYALALPHVERIYLTTVQADVEGDTSFPSLAWESWETIEETSIEADAKNDYASTFRIMRRS